MRLVALTLVLACGDPKPPPSPSATPPPKLATSGPSKQTPRAGHGSRAQCRRLLEHLVDLEFAKIATQSPELERQKTAVLDAKSDEFLDTCTTKTSRELVECALAARDLAAVAACDE